MRYVVTKSIKKNHLPSQICFTSIDQLDSADLHQRRCVATILHEFRSRFHHSAPRNQVQKGSYTQRATPGDNNRAHATGAFSRPLNASSFHVLPGAG